MGILALAADERVADLTISEDVISVRLKDGRTISVPIVWYPRLLRATDEQRKNWNIVGGGYGIHWPDVDEDLSTEGLLRGVPAPYRLNAAVPSYEDATRVVSDEKRAEDYLSDCKGAIIGTMGILSLITQEYQKLTEINVGDTDLTRLSSVLDNFSNCVKEQLPNFKEALNTLELSLSRLIGVIESESQVVSLRRSFVDLVSAAATAKQAAINGIELVSVSRKNRRDRLPTEVDKSLDRFLGAAAGHLAGLEEMESLWLKLIFQINEKVGTTDNKIE